MPEKHENLGDEAGAGTLFHPRLRAIEFHSIGLANMTSHSSR
jgi:hypothetical protein